MTKAAIKSVVRSCVEFQSIDPSPLHWRKGKLDVDTNWSQLEMDITHYGSNYFLTFIDCGGARGVMVIVVGNGYGDTSSNPGRD